MNSHIECNPYKKSGDPCIRNTRMTAQAIGHYVKQGYSLEDIQAAYLDVSLADVVIACWWLSVYGGLRWRGFRGWATYWKYHLDSPYVSFPRWKERLWEKLARKVYLQVRDRRDYAQEKKMGFQMEIRSEKTVRSTDF